MVHKSARMNTKGGDIRLVPFFQIEFWIKKRILDELGYTFVDEAGKKEYLDWIEAKAKAAAVTKDRPETFVRDGGIADAHISVGGSSTAEVIVPEPPADPPTVPDPDTEGDIPLPDTDPSEAI